MGATVRRLVVGIAVGLVAAACTPGPSPTTLSPSSSTSPAPSTTAAVPVAPPADLFVYPEPAVPDDPVELCAGVVASGASELVVSADRAQGVASVRTSQRGVGATCWEASLPETLVRNADGQATEVPLVPGAYEVAVVDDGLVMAVGSITVVEPSERGPSARWVGDPFLVGLPVSVAVSNAHAAGREVVLHGELRGVVDVALPSRVHAPLGGEPVHLWVDPAGTPAGLPYDLVSVAGATWLSRNPRFEDGHRPLLDLATRTAAAPATSLAEQLAWPHLGREPTVYLRTEASAGTVSLWTWEPSDGNVWTLTIFPADGPAGGEWQYEPAHGGPFVGLSASDGVRAVRLGVDPVLPPGDEGYPEDLPSVEVDENDLRRVIEELLAAWRTYPGGIEEALSPGEIHRTFLQDVIRQADARLYGPFVAVDYTGEVAPGSNQRSVTAPDGSETRVTFSPAAEAADRLLDDAVVDLDGPGALFIDDRGVWWFCLDTGFGLPADIDLGFAREMAAEVCHHPLFLQPVG